MPLHRVGDRDLALLAEHDFRAAAVGHCGALAGQELEALQLAFLCGRIEPGRLTRLAAMAEGEAGADPALREIIAGISLRARIELARLGPVRPGTIA